MRRVHPDAELLFGGKDGWQLKKQLLEPGYRNAYGLAMLIHHEVREKDGEKRFLDHGIRTHGSVSFRSITRGDSHGCHRLFNHLALRLADFLILHRPLARRGKLSTGYQRTLEWEGETIEIDMKERGYLYELDPLVRVLEGRVGGRTSKAALLPVSHGGQSPLTPRALWRSAVSAHLSWSEGHGWKRVGVGARLGGPGCASLGLRR